MRSAGIRRRRWQPERGSHLSSGWPLQWRWPSRRSNRGPARQSVRANRLSRLRRGKSSTGLNTGTCTEASVAIRTMNAGGRMCLALSLEGLLYGSLQDRTRCPKVVETISLVNAHHEVAMRNHPIVSENEWLDARARLLA